MPRLCHRDLEALLSATGALYATTDLNALPNTMLGVISRVIDVEVVTYDTVDAITGEVRVRQLPVNPEVIEVLPALAAHFSSHPIIPSFFAGKAEPVKVSDFATLTQFRRTAVFNEVYRDLGVQHQMAIFPQVPHGTKFLGSSFTLSRLHRDFSERDRQVLAHLTPHFKQAYLNALALQNIHAQQQRMLNACAASSQQPVVLGRDLRPKELSRTAASWLKRYFPGRADSSDLPQELKRWITRQRSEGIRGGVVPLRPLVVRGSDSRLVVRLYSGDDGPQMLLLTEEQSIFAPERLAKLGLTLREGEVLRWMAEGKTDSEIGVILGVSAHTSHKHAQNILAKLDARNRASALLRLYEAAT